MNRTAVVQELVRIAKLLVSAKYFRQTGGFLTSRDLAYIKKCADLMRLSWQMIAARPENSEVLLAARDAGKAPEKAILDYKRKYGVQASRSMKAGRISPLVVREIAKLTDQNHHTESVILLAEELGQRADVEVLKSMLVIQSRLMEIPQELNDLRYEILGDLLHKAKSQMSADEYELLYQSF